MQRNSEGSGKVLNLLLLLEQLKRQRPDLSPVELGNLIGSAAGKGRKPSRAAVALFDQTIAELNREGIKVVDPLDLLALGLIGMVDVRPPGIAPVGREELAAEGIVIQPTGRPAPKTMKETRTFFTSLPGKVPLRRAARFASRIVATERGRELACAVISPFLIRGITTGNPIVAGAALAALAGCGFEFVEDTS